MKNASDNILTLCFAGAAFIVVMDVTIANIAVSVVSGYYGISTQQGLWIITSFGVTHAISMLLTGWLTNLYGEGKVFVSCFIFFIITSFGCGMSLSIESLVIFRAIQGAAAGPIVPLSQVLLLKGHDYNERGKQLSVWSCCIVLAPLAGPVIGGYLCENFSWQWLFLINIPAGVIILSVLLSRGIVSLRNKKSNKSPDIISLTLLIFVAFSWQLFAETIKQQEPDTLIFKVIIFGLVFLTLFSFVYEVLSDKPVLHLNIFYRRNFISGMVLWVFSYIINFGALLPLILSDSYGYTSLQIGLVCAPSALAPLLLSKLIGKLTARLDCRLMLCASFIMFSIVFFWRSLYLQQQTTFSMVAWSSFFQGIASVLFFIPLTMITYSEVSDNEMAMATTLCNFVRSLTGTIGSTITYLIWVNRNKFHVLRIRETGAYNNDYVLYYLEQLYSHGLDEESSLSTLSKLVEQIANIMAINDIFWLNGYVFLFMLPIIILIKKIDRE